MAADPAALDRALAALLPDPSPASTALRAIVAPALDQAASAPLEVLTVSGTTSRPRSLQLAALAADYSADQMYRREWVEFAVEAAGQWYLVYRSKNNQDYAVPWSRSLSLPGELLRLLPPALVAAITADDATPA